MTFKHHAEVAALPVYGIECATLLRNLNLHRRHLDASQLAFVALEVERVEAVLAAERRAATLATPTPPRA